jgi:hypothetical protein
MAASMPICLRNRPNPTDRKADSSELRVDIPTDVSFGEKKAVQEKNLEPPFFVKSRDETRPLFSSIKPNPRCRFLCIQAPGEFRDGI